MDKFKAFFKNTTNLIAILIGFVGSYLIFQNYFVTNVSAVATLPGQLWTTLDPSWMVALNYANTHELIYGKDISFTYGPLAYLVTRVGWYENKYAFLAYDLFFFLNYFFIFFFCVKRSNNKLITIFSILSILIIFPSNSVYGGALMLMAFLIFWIRMSIDEPKPFYFIFQILIVSVAFFIKFNTGLIAFPLFYSGLVYNAICKKEKLYILSLYAVIPLIIVFSLSSYLNVSFISYIVSGLEMISGYNQIMYLDNQINKSIGHLSVMLALLTVIILINLNLREKKEWLKKAVIFFLFATSFFILYKQTFTRADGHVFDFFIFVPMLVVCNLDLHINSRNWVTKILFIIVLMIPAKFLFIDNDREIEIANKLPKSTYIEGFNSFTPTTGMNLFPNTSQLPATVLQKIGNQTVDIYPWNIQLLLCNKLNYKPRPVIQSYTAYTPTLENINFIHYNSESAPEFVVYEIGSVDARYAFFDEPKLNLALTLNYKIAEKFEFEGRNLVLMQKRADFKPIQLEKLKEYAMYINSPLKPQSGIYYEVEAYDNFLGKIVSIIDHSPEIKVEIVTEDGNRSEFKTSKLLLKSGLFYDRIISETINFSSIFENPEANNKIICYRFNPVHPSQYKGKIKITEYKIVR